MKKFILAAILFNSNIFACETCLKYHLEREIANSDEIIQELIDSETEENIAYFFFALGRRHAMNEIRMLIEEKHCVTD